MLKNKILKNQLEKKNLEQPIKLVVRVMILG